MRPWPPMKKFVIVLTSWGTRKSFRYNMALGVVEFSSGGTKLERFLPKNQHTQRKLLNFENWVNGEVSKIGHHFSK